VREAVTALGSSTVGRGRAGHDAGDAVAGGARHEQGREDQRGRVMGGAYSGMRAAAAGQMEKQRPSATEAATDLARLIERGMGSANGHIDPVALRIFIESYWKRLAALAHAIHDGGGG
jgi:hypothetical protein